MNAFKFRARSNGIHVEVLVYVGPDEDHLAFSGKLMFEVGEYQSFCRSILRTNELLHFFPPDAAREYVVRTPTLTPRDLLLKVLRDYRCLIFHLVVAAIRLHKEGSTVWYCQKCGRSF